MNKFSQRGSLYWDEFASFLRRNVNPVNTHLKFERQDTKNLPDMCTIMDYNRPYKKGLIDSKYGRHTDWERDSQVVNCGWLNGEIPMIGWQEPSPLRGVRQTVKILLKEGVLLPTQEVADLLRATQR